MEDKRQRPLWIANAFVFILLFAAVCAYFSWQIHLVKNSFRFHADQHADVVSKVVRLNASAAIEAEKSIENILQNLLENTARFVAYLDMVEPFSIEELTAFTRESGLAGISIIREGYASVHAPSEKWLPDDFFRSSNYCPPKEIKSNLTHLKHLPQYQMYLLVWREHDYHDCIVLGINDDKISAITESLSLKNLIKALSTVSGIKDVIVDGMQINVDVDSSELNRAIQQLTIHFYLFGFFLITAGIILSFVLHRYQSAAINRVKEFERELAAERENATLGKSAAAIAHEIRNPLNSLSMGLQRLAIEKGCPSESHIKLVSQMLQAVKRANSSVTGLLNYARPRVPKIKSVNLESLVVDILNLYRRRCSEQKIDITLDFKYHGEIKTDPELMGQVIENIIKNSVEAQLYGGFIKINTDINLNNNSVILAFKNGNCPIEPETADKIFEPYFTTRPEGTGLGMAIVKNIIKSLDGGITIQITESKEILTTICLPIK